MSYLGTKLKRRKIQKLLKQSVKLKCREKFMQRKFPALKYIFNVNQMFFCWLILLIKLYKIFYYQLQGFISTLHFLQQSLRRQFSKLFKLLFKLLN